MTWRRAVVLVAAVTLFATACGSDPDSGRGAAGRGGGTFLRYAYQPGQVLAYDVDLSMDMTMKAGGGSAAAGIPDTQMVMGVTERMELAFAEGPAPDTVEITTTQEILEGGAQMTVMGQTQFVPMRDLARDLDVTTVVVVDAQGKVVEASVGGQPLPTQLLEEMGSAGTVNPLQPLHLGPQFPDHGLALGDAWTTETSLDLFGLAVRQTADHRVVDTEEVLGRRTYRIDSRIDTETIDVDLGEMLTAMLQSPELFGGDAAEIQMAADMLSGMDMDMRFRIPRSTMEMTTWFDPAAGVVVRLLLDSPITMELSLDDLPQVGDLEVTIAMDASQRMELAG
jgi:hypothetical protein